MKKIIALLFAFIFLLSLSFETQAVSPSTNALPTKVRVAWDPSPDAVTNNPPDGLYVVGYKIYIGNSSRSYNQVIDVGNVTNGVVTNLTAGVTYYFAVTAYAYLDPSNPSPNNQVESDYSAELAYTMPTKPSAPINLRITLTQVEAKWRDVVAYVRRTWFSKPLVC